jgi:protein involved in polysaccharide export with SLBB domain
LSSLDTKQPPVAGDPAKNPFSRDLIVQSDGAIYGFGFGRLLVSGLTVNETQSAVRQAMKRLFRPADVFVTLVKQRVSTVYVVGSNAPGPVDLPVDGVTLSQLLPPATQESDVQRLDVQLTRNGRVVGRTSYSKALNGADPLGGTRILPNDLVSVVPQENVRVWVVGPVKNPGQVVLPVGASIYEALASSGGVTSLQSATRVVLRHGPDTTEFPATPDPRANAPKLTEGDVVTVVAPEQIHVTVTGKVEKPNDYLVDGGTTVLQAISRASGTTSEASLGRVFLFRDGEARQFDFTALAKGGQMEDPVLRAGDLVYVDENRRSFYVFGHVDKPGRFSMDETRSYHATDGLALAGGLDPRGSMRKVVLYRANPNGKPTIIQFNLDEFIKDGKQSSNPEILPGDALLFSEPKGLTFASISQVMSAYFYLNTVVKP